MIGHIAFGLFGLAVLIAIGWVFSVDRRAVDWRLVATGVALQIAFATVVLTGPGMITRVMHGAPWFFLNWVRIVGALAAGWAVLALLNQVTAGGRSVPLRLAARALAIAALVLLLPFLGTAFDLLASGFVKVLGFVAAGSGFVFGSLIDPSKFGFVFAFQVLPTIIFFAALMAVLYHLNAMQNVVKGMAWAITRVMRVSGAETTSVCASVFIGQTEAPLTVRPYLARMTPSELITVMIGGMAHIAGGVLAAYVAMLGGTDDETRQFYALHLLTASIMAAPATLVIAKVLVPETGEPLTRGQVKMEVEKTTANVIDAAASGAGDGLRLALNVGAMLLAFIALIALINAPLQWLGEVKWFASDFTINGWLTGASATPVTLSLQTIFGYVLAPIAWVIGVPWQDADTVGSLIGQKIVINEFVAYIGLSDVINGRVPGVTLSDQGRLIATYALCGFANFSSIAIQIGGIGGLAPERRTDLARFGLRAVLGGTLATFMTATIAGVLSRYA